MLELAALKIALQKQPELLPLLLQVQQQSEELYSQKRWGDLAKWRNTLAELPDIEAVQCLLDDDQVSLSSNSQDINKTQLYDTLQQLHPWRKGPFNFFDIEINTEWRSDWKWQRVLPHISPLHNRSILDVGCGNGYHCWRMRGAGAKLVLGIDPSMRFVMQYHALKKYLPQQPVFVLPYAMEQLPAKLNAFDTVFSMGVLYHRRSPFDHLQELFDCLRPGGELVLETLVLPTGHDSVLVPGQRYAQMRNVWFIPSAEVLPAWLARVGFKDAKVVDVTTTSTDEQRATPWMKFHSLCNFLDDQDPSKTVEGYPAPTRAIVVAQKPG